MIRRLKKDVLSQLPAKRRMRVPLDPERMDQETLREVQRRVQKMDASHEQDADGIRLDDDGLNMPELFRLTAEAKLGAVLEYVRPPC